MNVVFYLFLQQKQKIRCNVHRAAVLRRLKANVHVFSNPNVYGVSYGVYA